MPRVRVRLLNVLSALPALPVCFILHILSNLKGREREFRHQYCIIKVEMLHGGIAKHHRPVKLRSNVRRCGVLNVNVYVHIWGIYSCIRTCYHYMHTSIMLKANLIFPGKRGIFPGRINACHSFPVMMV